VLTEFTTELFFDQTLINALTTSVSPDRIARPAGHQQRGGQHRFQLDAVDAANVTTGGGYARP
jgi:hypothetical protein